MEIKILVGLEFRFQKEIREMGIEKWKGWSIMEKLKLYTVIKSSSDKNVKVGDTIWISENGDLNFAKEKGWLTKEEWDSPQTNDFEVEECADYYLDVFQRAEIVRKRVI